MVREEERDEEEMGTPIARKERVGVVRRSKGKQRMLRPHIGPATSATSSPRQDKADRRLSRTDEDTRERRIGFFPRQGIG